MKRRQAVAVGGATLLSLLTALVTLGILLSLSYSVYRGVRRAVQIAAAEHNLQQVAIALELYYLRHHRLPPAGADLTVELAPFLKDPRVFRNPMMDEASPGQTLNDLYYEPHPSQVDRPNFYVTAFISGDGTTAVVLKTGGIIERRDGLELATDNLAQASTQLAGNSPPDPSAPPPAAPSGGFDIADDGATVTRNNSDVTVRSLGAQFGYADGTLVQMKAYIKIGNGAWQALFGGSVVSATGGQTYQTLNVPAGTKILIKAEVYDTYSRNLLSRYGWPLSYESNDGTGQVVTLRNGDLPVNDNPAYPCQVGVGSLLMPLVDPQTGRTSIQDGQAIYCFDFNPLGTNRGIDYNDVCIMATATVAGQ